MEYFVIWRLNGTTGRPSRCEMRFNAYCKFLFPLRLPRHEDRRAGQYQPIPHPQFAVSEADLASLLREFSGCLDPLAEVGGPDVVHR